MEKENIYTLFNALRDDTLSILADRGPWTKVSENVLQPEVEIQIDKRKKELLLAQETVKGLLQLLDKRADEVDKVQLELTEKAKKLREDEELFEKNNRLAQEKLDLDHDLVVNKGKEIDFKEKELSAWRNSAQVEVDLARQSLEKKAKEIELKETKCAALQKSVESQLEEVKVREEKLEKSLQEVKEEKKKCEKWVEELKVKEDELDFDIQLRSNDLSKQNDLERRELLERSEELKSWEDKLNIRHGELEQKEKKLRNAEETILSFGTKFEEQTIELKSREKKLEKQVKELELKEKKIDAQQSELVSKSEQIEESLKKIELKEKRMEEQLEGFKSQEKKIGFNSNHVDCLTKKLDGRQEEIDSKENRLKELYKELEQKEKIFQEQLNDFKVKEEELNERLREFELKEKSNFEVKVKPEGNVCPEDANLRFVVKMDGKELQLFLNEQWSWKNHDILQSELFTVLQKSSNPPKLVLDAMQGFYPPHLKRDDFEFDRSVVINSCILLLEQLMRISPKIKPAVKNEAMILSSDWITKMKADVEVLGFLLLVAAYGLANEYDAAKLLNYIEDVAPHSQAPKLLRALGFGDKISGFIQNLVEKQQHVEAVKFVKEFELTAQYPIVSLLKSYLENSEKRVCVITNDKNTSIITKNEARERRISDVKNVLKCIEEYKLETEFPLSDVNGLATLISNLEKKIAYSKSTLANPPCSNGPVPANDINTPTTPATKCPPNQAKVLNKNISRKKAKVSDLHQARVESLLKDNKFIDAVKYVYELNLVDHFPPVPLLKDFLAFSKTKAEDNCKKMKNSITSQLGVIGKEMYALEQVIRCIKTYKLENEYSSKMLEERIIALKKQQSEKTKQKNEEDKAERKKDLAKTPISTKETTSFPNKEMTPGTTKTSPSTTTRSRRKRAFSSTISPEKKRPKMESSNKRPHVSVRENQFPNNQQLPSYYNPNVAVNSLPNNYSLPNTPLYYGPPYIDPHMQHANISAGIPPCYDPYMGNANYRPY
ncbi:hypothetical protein ACFE04_005542 [Oxalis oulophora]